METKYKGLTISIEKLPYGMGRRPISYDVDIFSNWQYGQKKRYTIHHFERSTLLSEEEVLREAMTWINKHPKDRRMKYAKRFLK